MKIKNLFLILALAIVQTVSALESGYYYVVSHNGKYLTENITDKSLVCSASIPGNYSQVWLLSVDGSSVTFKNALTDDVITGPWSQVFIAEASNSASPQKFYPVLSDNTYTFPISNGGDMGLHCDNSNNVVQWYTNESKSVWTIEEASFDANELATQKANMTEASTDDLLKVFTTTACTELKSGYAESDLTALPSTVRAMAAKIKNNSWATYSGWDKSEKSFRIADYKAYSSSERWTSIIGLGYSFGHLTNPTGISVTTGEFLQVYVGSIPSGQSVQLEVVDEHQAVGTTYPLEQGMNTLLMASSGNCFVQYEVDNTTNGSTPYTAIDSYAPVTVHIEGGTVNGYFDLTKGDDNDDWTKLQTNLLKGATVDIKTSNLLFHMNTDLVKAACPTQMVELLGEWDKILNLVHSLMGLEEFNGYWNNLLSVTDMSGQDYMHASTYGTYYDVSTIASIMSYEELFAGNAIWGPAHENGHIFQKYINMVGCTEVSNNLFSNAAVYSNGHLTSRATNISVTFENLANNVFWNDRDIWERTHLYFQLYQFFHILGKKSDFYPELFKALRSDPMVHTGGIFTSATDDYLKFYKKCCQVSGYDLTEFFQAYGFFVIPKLTSYTLNSVTKEAYKVEDYGDYYLTVTQAEIDAAKQAVADMNLPKANIIFIEDRISAPDATYEGAPLGAKKTAFDAGNPIGQVGETGQYTSFGATCSAYSYNISSKGNVTMSGTGAVGFKLYDASGNLCGAYNTYDFALPSEAYTSTDLTPGYSIKAAAGDGTDAVATRNTNIEVNEDVKDVNPMAESAEDVIRKGSKVTSAASVESGKPYLLYYSGSNNSGFVKAKENYFQANYLDETPTQESVFRFISTGDESPQYAIQSNWWNTYFPVPTKSTTFKPSDEGSAGFWALNFQTNGNIAPSCNGYSINRSTLSGTTRVIHGWDAGTAAANQLQIYEIAPSSILLDGFVGYDVVVAGEPAATLETGQWYVMYDRGANHGYLYENASSHTLYNTSTVPGGYAPDNAKFLVRIVGENDNYYIQTGYGNYFGEFKQSTAVSTTALRENLITIKKIAKTDGHYYLTSSAGTVLDANATTNGDATVVGYGTTVPTATGGNNDWAFYPVTLQENHVLCLLSSDVSVIQGHQTTGKGNTMQALLRVKAKPFKACKPTKINITLSGIENLDNVAVYTTTSDQLRASGVTPVKVSDDITPSESLSIPVAMESMNPDETIYFWVTCDVKSTAAEWGTIDAAITSIEYTNAYIDENSLDHTVCDIEEMGNPDGSMRIYKSQTALWTSSKSGSKYYRIPALLKTGTNTLLAFTDDRYASTTDLGNHKIDVIVKKSTDGGLTWGNAVTVAAGDGSSDAGYGYGDAAVAQAANGDIVCLMAAGKTKYASGMLHIGLSKSTDGGATWSNPIDIYDNSDYLTNPHASGSTTPFVSTFVSSGHGITQTIANAGRIAFPALGKISRGTNEYVIYSDDNGATWTFTNNLAYTGADESKLVELNDGKLLMSIRTGSFNSSNVARGFNRTTDTNVENWGTQGTWSDLTANGCNSDLIYYKRSTDSNSGPDVMLHSVVKSYSNSHRKDLRLYMSFDQGNTWQEAFQLQPGWAAYSSMQVLDNGDLAILFEDGSIGNEDINDCFDINYVVISSELMESKIDDLLEEYEDDNLGVASIKVVNGTTGETIYGAWSGLTWTSNATSGKAGFTLTASAGSHDKYSSLSSRYALAYKVATAGTPETLTLTAPTGYVITGYSLQAVNGGTAAYTYTLTAADNTAITTTSANNTTYKDLVVTGVDSNSTTITVDGTAVDWLAIANFTVEIAKSGVTKKNVMVTNNEATSYGTVASNVWTSGENAGLEGLTITSSDMTVETKTAFSNTVLGLKVTAGNGNSGTLTMTAPSGYLILGYDIEAHNWSSNNSFTITPVEGIGNAVTVTNYASGSTTAMSVNNIGCNVARLTVTANTQTNPLCLRKFNVVLYNTSERTITYAIVDNDGNIATQVENVSTYIGNVPELPTSSIDKRPWCTYDEVLYKDAACTIPATRIYSYTKNLYSKLVYNGPFEFSTEENPKWYLIKSYASANEAYYMSNNNTAFSSTRNEGDGQEYYSNHAYQWAFIGNPYSAKVLNRAGGYLSAAAVKGNSNPTTINSKIADEENSYENNTFSLYGITNVNMTLPSNSFALALNGSNNKTWVDGAEQHRIVYHSGITINANLQINNWLKANMQPIAVPTTYPVALNAVGDASYATLYLPFDVQTDGYTKAYFIATVNNGGYALLTATGNEGRDIPANTAVVLVNENQVSGATFTVANGLEPVINEETNLLKGTLTSMALDLSDSTPYYSLGRKDGAIGFYKFNNNGTTTITLGANKAYLDTTAPGGEIKGFLLSFDEDATGIDAIDNGQLTIDGDAAVYDLSGRRVTKPARGIYIVNGQKAVVK